MEVSRFYKHFKGKNLIEKNIYLIIAIGVDEKYFDLVKPKYVGNNPDNFNYSDLVIYLNYFQGKLFAREYTDLNKELSVEEQEKYCQIKRVEPLTNEEIKIIFTEEYITQKKKYLEIKYGTKK